MIQISKETEEKLRDNLDFLRSYLDFLNHVIKYRGSLWHHLGVNAHTSVSFESDLNKLKMGLIREIGNRRKNLRLMGKKSRFPGDI